MVGEPNVIAMKILITPLIVGLLFLLPTSDVEARVYNLFGGAAKITLPEGAKVQSHRSGLGKGYQVLLSKADTENRVYIYRTSLRPSLSSPKWRKDLVAYYNKVIKSEPGYKRNRLRSLGNQVLIDFQYVNGPMQSRTYVKFVRVRKASQVQATYSTSELNRWSSARAQKLIAVVDSLH